MSRFAGQMSRPWVGMAAGSGTASEPPTADVAAAAAASSMRGADSATNASAISFGFAATAVLVSMFLLMAIFEHLIKPGLASSSRSRGSGSHDDDDDGEGRGHGRRLGLPPARLHERDASPPDKLSHSPKVEEPVAAVVDLTVLMPGHRYPTFLAQPAPLAPCPREGVLWPSHHDRRSSFLPP
ncbi:uncharacterized protein LOC8077135 [Sorghum bicolor]|uniref:Uncharacterized protein n=1 Tax=Sorghum bicolor TaxID=4558 RepID=A0A1B6P8Q2_SORBI|nr:uncharacterized protein LOC8077135 [Sorghum bicolor]XP_021302993.1 uncharacterized protein LOC8077135 [Sorghum bicolor]XP_021302994.1 uncharacterized protein LOC8077135 [Sorghum bicolor]KXG22042.1 hypothetical protein SORBI_3009G144500 [Sorghum bicolor]KXG22043.1 hypothetical protein SORBI_3009G144500 [Sorghum bicolor]OQU78044.1 hypothetical protein SORBI_3009G144500 [Sorghum bicolor]|eukprot:XP_002439835.2 uncharacterized protein LOC8077135 [Sorghum bicolor]